MKTTLPPIITKDFFETRCRKKGIVLDTNILNLYIIGCAKHGKLEKDTPLVEKYSEKDFKLLEALVKISKNSNSLYISPQTIPETLFELGVEPRRKKKTSRQIPAEKINNLCEYTIAILKESNEDIYHPTPEIINIMGEEPIKMYGVPDLSFIPGIKSREYAFLSDDPALVAYMYSQDICAITWKDFKQNYN